jgi:hypothetical protein
MLAHAVDTLHTLHGVASIVLAVSDDTGDEGGENQKAGPLGLAIVLLLCVACYFLFRSMSRRLRNVRENFPADPPSSPPPPIASPAADEAVPPTPVQSITSIPKPRPPD